MRYGAEIEKLGLKSLLKFINSLRNKALGKINRKIIENMFRVPLIHKIWNDSIDQINIKNFLTNLNKKKIRTQITDEEYGFTYQIPSDYSLTTKIILPNFEREILLIYSFNVMKIIDLHYYQ